MLTKPRLHCRFCCFGRLRPLRSTEDTTPATRPLQQPFLLLWLQLSEYLGCGENNRQNRGIRRAVLWLQGDDCAGSPIFRSPIRILRAGAEFRYALVREPRDWTRPRSSYSSLSRRSSRRHYLSSRCSQDSNADPGHSGQPLQQQSGIIHGEGRQEPQAKGNSDSHDPLGSTNSA